MCRFTVSNEPRSNGESSHVAAVAKWGRLASAAVASGRSQGRIGGIHHPRKMRMMAYIKRGRRDLAAAGRREGALAGVALEEQGWPDHLPNRQTSSSTVPGAAFWSRDGGRPPAHHACLIVDRTPWTVGARCQTSSEPVRMDRDGFFRCLTQGSSQRGGVDG